MAWGRRGSALSLSALLACSSGNAPPPSGRDAGRLADGAADASSARDGGATPDGETPPEDAALGQDAGFPALIRVRTCTSAIEYRPPAGAPRDVFVAGEWNGFRPDATRLRDRRGDGVFTATVSLAPGLYAYKLVVDGNWQLDPSLKYRAYSGGVENSGLRVPDCQRPLLELIAPPSGVSGAGRGQVSLGLRYTEGSQGPGPDPRRFSLGLRGPAGTRALTASEWNWDPARWEAHVQLADLPDGKYTLTATAANLSGALTERVVVPFWVEAEAFDWRDGVLYMVVTDRFRNGDTANDPPQNPRAASSADYHGGDLAGVTQAIDEGYFDALGVRSLWLTPFQVNPPGEYADGDGTHFVTGYHGYWPAEPRRVDARLGGDAALAALTAKAHAHGIRVLMDFVVNHVHETHPYVAAHPGWFSALPNGCLCGTSGCDWTERRLDCLFQPYLPDVDWTNAGASEAFITDALWWLDHFDLDGLRVDAVKHVPDGAVFNLSTRVEETLERGGTTYFRVGETAMGWGNCDPADLGCNAENYGTIARYIGPHALHGQFDFVLRFAVGRPVFGSDEYGMIHADVWSRASQERYPAGAIMTTYVGSHDESRFISAVSDPGLLGNKWPEQQRPTAPRDPLAYRRLGLALTWNLTLPGAPLLYYGDEYGEFGAADPDNRHPMRFEGDRSAEERSLAAWVSAIGSARRELLGLRRGALLSLRATEPFWAYARAVPGGPWAVVAINKSAQPTTQEVSTAAVVHLSAGARVTDRLALGSTVSVSRDDTLRISLPPWSAAIIAP